jgi:hypothetical protein
VSSSRSDIFFKSAGEFTVASRDPTLSDPAVRWVVSPARFPPLKSGTLIFPPMASDIESLANARVKETLGRIRIRRACSEIAANDSLALF